MRDLIFCCHRLSPFRIFGFHRPLAWTVLIQLFATPLLWTHGYAQSATAVPGSPVGELSHNIYELPDSRAASTRLGQEASFVWEGKPLRSGLDDLRGTYGLLIWLDRRIDPGQRIDFQVSDLGGDRSLNAALIEIASKVAAESGLIENIFYIGPPGEPAKLQRAASQLHDRMCKAKGTGDTALKPFRWPELASPTEVLESLSKSWQVAIDGELPHDLMHSAEMGACTLATQLTLLCGGFDMEATLAPDGRIRLSPLSSETSWQYAYRRKDLNSKMISGAALGRLLRVHGGSVRSRGQTIVVSGSTPLHLALLQMPASSPRSTNLQNERWTLVVQNKPVENVLREIAASVGLTVSWNPEISSEKRERLASFQVDKATLDEMLSAWAEAAGLQIERQGLTVLVTK